MSKLLKAAVAAAMSTGGGGGSSVLAPEDAFASWTYKSTGAVLNINTGVGLAKTSVGISTIGIPAADTNGYAGTSATMAVDASNNVYISGTVNGDGGGYPFLAKYNAAGVGQWVKDVRGTVIKVSAAGTVYMLDGSRLSKFDTNGTNVWSYNLGSTLGTASFYALYLDASENIYIAGTLNGATASVMIAKFDSSCNKLWAKSCPDPFANNNYITFIYDIGISTSGNIYLAGSYGNSAGLLIKLDSTGTFIWGKTQGGAIHYAGIAIDSAENIYVGCDDQQTLSAAGYRQGGVTAYNSSGTKLWGSLMGDPAATGGDQAQAYGCVSINEARNQVHVGLGSNGQYNNLVAFNMTTGAVVWKKRMVAENSTTGRAFSGGATFVRPDGGLAWSGLGRTKLWVANVPIDGTGDGTYLSNWTYGNSVLVYTNSSSEAAPSNQTFNFVAGAAGTLSTSSSPYASNNTALTQTSVAPFTATQSGDGLVLLKRRDLGTNMYVVDTVRGAGNVFQLPTTNAQQVISDSLTGFTSTGFTLGVDASAGAVNAPAASAAFHASWTFKKATKFFDIIAYTGDGTTGRQIAHALGVAPGLVIVKKVAIAGAMPTYHISNAFTFGLAFNNTETLGNSQLCPITAASSTTVTLNKITESAGSTDTNANGVAYIMYLFAHDPDQVNGIIQCGTYTEPSSGRGQVNLGWEPQFLMIKSTDVTSQWYMFDVMRGFNTINSAVLFPSAATVESDQGVLVSPNANGFSVNSGAFGSGKKLVYVAIRRPTKTPTSGSKVYNAIARTGIGGQTRITGLGFSPDLVISKARSVNAYTPAWFNRLSGLSRVNETNLNAEAGNGQGLYSFDPDGYTIYGQLEGATYLDASGTTYINWCLRRAPKVFDVVITPQTVPGNPYQIWSFKHNLGVPPELIITKYRDLSASWDVIMPSLGTNNHLQLNSAAAATPTGITVPAQTASTAYVGGLGAQGDVAVNYLFATLAGISKVGTYTGTNAFLNVDCGFAAGARFVMIRRLDGAGGDWVMLDTARGISASNDPYLKINSANAETTNVDLLIPYAGGFGIVAPAGAGINTAGGLYMFVAFA